MDNNKKGLPIITILIIAVLIIAIIIGVKVLSNKSNDPKENSSKSNEIIDNLSTTFEVKDTKCKNGEEITVEIEMLNDSDFVAANFEYVYDDDNLEYVSYKVGESFSEAAMTMVNNDDTNKKVLIGFVANPEDSDKTIKSGKILSLTFKVKDKISTNSINNTLECSTLKRDDGSDVKYKINQGIIEVE